MEKAAKKVKYMSEEWFIMKEITTHDISFRLEPDDIREWEGLISPSGDFYSCGFGMHAIKAWRLIMMRPEKFGINLTEAEREEMRIPGNVYKFLDIAIEHGWAATREIGGSNYYTLPQRPTKAQVNTIFDAAEKHHRRVDMTELLFC